MVAAPRLIARAIRLALISAVATSAAVRVGASALRIAKAVSAKTTIGTRAISA
jgi:hypothetical protein